MRKQRLCVAWVVLIGMAVPSGTMAQDFTKPTEPSPEVQRGLPAQPADRGNLMPLHGASVLTWLCTDPQAQSDLGTTKKGCYQQLAPSVTACTESLQDKAPAAQNRTDGGRYDIVSFRATFYQCVKSHYAASLATKGQVSALTSAGAPDPLAAKMQGIAK